MPAVLAATYCAGIASKQHRNYERLAGLTGRRELVCRAVLERNVMPIEIARYLASNRPASPDICVSFAAAETSAS